MKMKPETIRKYLNALNARIAFYMTQDPYKIPLCISDGNNKIGHALNVSQPPIKTCGRCSHCMIYCYDVKTCVFRSDVIDARARNYVILQLARERYFQEIRGRLSRLRRKNPMFRWHVGGEIPDAAYFAEMVQIARDFPRVKFWTYTKVHFIVNEYVRTNGGTRAAAIPRNLKIMFSEWDGMPMENPYNFPIFTCKLAAGNQNHPADFFETLYKCPGNCDVCRDTGRGCIVGESTYADEH